jgi:hypothetical protein
MNAGNARIGAGNARVHLFARGVYCGPAPVRAGEIREHGHTHTPGRDVGAEAQLREQQAEAARLDAAIAANLKELRYGGGMAGDTAR